MHIDNILQDKFVKQDVYNMFIFSLVQNKYACRKTLADSRPRVKGRFARNGEPETEAERELENFAANNYGCYNRGSYNTYEANSTNTNGDQGDLWRKIEQAMEADDDGSTYFADEEMWNNLSEMLPMNMLS
jgi:CCT motif